MADYDFKSIEERGLRRWAESGLFRTPERPRKKYYVLEMFAYPSGDIHMGHFRNYTIGDVVARYRMMTGHDVLHPFGWDAFGMPAEAAAIKNNLHPKDWTLNNIQQGRETLQKMGIGYDWDREVTTCLPDYYRWTQWLFLLLFRRGLAYQAPSQVNWCDTCRTILANEQAQDGACWRCKNPVVKKELDRCWFLKYTDYADRLLRDLDRLPGWPENVKIMQRNWIGRSEGCEIEFAVEGAAEKLRVFTTRPDTIYGVTFMTLAPEHPMVKPLVQGTPHEKAVMEYVKRAAQKADRDRTAAGEKDGVDTGRSVLHPLTGARVPLWVGDYVLAGYGTGAVMGVPAHDQRDFAFARKYGLEIKVVIQPPKDSGISWLEPAKMNEAYEDAGVMVESGPFNGIDSREGIRKVIEHIEQKKSGRARVQYKLKDWLISRQRYWGCPIPIIHCASCGPQAVPEKDLPVLLPDVRGRDLLPKGRSPLEDVPEFRNAPCPKCGGAASRDGDTMDTFMDSSFYLFRYADAHNGREAWAKEEVRKWLPVDIYIGGVEHACMHLLYFRFITKVLFDAGHLPVDEPVERMFNHGMVLDEQGRIMSKSLGNVVSPREIMDRWGVDVARLAMLFFAPSGDEIRWSERGLVGANRFVERFRSMVHELADRGGAAAAGAIPQDSLTPEVKAVRRKLHQTIRKITESMSGDLHFNTSIAALMELLNTVQECKVLTRDMSGAERPAARELAETMVLLIAPMAPFLAEDLWSGVLRCGGSVFRASWPAYDAGIAKADELEIVIQIAGKVRGRLTVAAGIAEEDLKRLVLESEVVQKILAGQSPRKVIVVRDKLVNIVP